MSTSAATQGADMTATAKGYEITQPSDDTSYMAVSLDGDELFDVRLYEDEGESLEALRSTLAHTLTPQEAVALRRLFGALSNKGYDDVTSGPLADLYRRLAGASS